MMHGASHETLVVMQEIGKLHASFANFVPGIHSAADDSPSAVADLRTVRRSVTVSGELCLDH